jgi:molybdopterin molybdotransferase
MLEYKEALKIILDSAEVLPAERVVLNQALQRVLAEDVFSDMNMPPFNKSAMDGYACRRSDLGNELEIVETIYAGKMPERQISGNQCYKIMTGAMVPDPADFVLKKEDALEIGENRVICTRQSQNNNICYLGEDIRAGDKLLGHSALICPAHLPVLAGAGVTRPAVYQLPEVAVFAIGTELVEPEIVPLPHQIRNSNTSQLTGQFAGMNIHAKYGGIIPDDEDILERILQETVESYPVTILTGGVSVGDYDLVPGILNRLGFEILVTATAIKPGKPLVFARKGNRYCFGLSGNPVSSFVQFELYVKPFLYRLMGHEHQPQILRLPFGAEYNRSFAGRMNFIPVNVIPEMEVVPVDFHGSAHIHALSFAGYLMEVPVGVKTIRKGEPVLVRQI